MFGRPGTTDQRPKPPVRRPCFFPGLGIEALLPLDPLVHERVAQGIGQGAVAVLIAGAVEIAALKAFS